MTNIDAMTRFEVELLRPANPGEDRTWSFLVLPKDASIQLPRRGRTTIDGTLNGHPFQATLEPDGRRSHWLKVDKTLREAAGAEIGDIVTLEIAPVEQEPDPQVPDDLRQALEAAPKAQAVWSDITTIARLDWIHWITSAKQSATRARRITNACDMLGSGKRRVCCFDSSGVYSKAFTAPEAAD